MSQNENADYLMKIAFLQERGKVVHSGLLLYTWAADCSSVLRRGIRALFTRRKNENADENDTNLPAGLLISDLHPCLATHFRPGTPGREAFGHQRVPLQ
jgi:hypothetical protein